MAVLSAEGKRSKRIGVLLTTNSAIRKINKRHLFHDYATDVISFPMDEEIRFSGGAGFLGDIVVSVDMAKAMSKKLGISYREEVARYLIHGALHLLGYDDKEPEKRAKMHLKQEFLLKQVLS